MVWRANLLVHIAKDTNGKIQGLLSTWRCVAEDAWHIAVTQTNHLGVNSSQQKHLAPKSWSLLSEWFL